MPSLSRPQLAAVCLCAAAALSACAQAPAKPAVAQAPAEQQAPPPRPAPKPPREEPLPKQELTAQILYQTMLAEIAAQRGQVDFAVKAYLDLAKTTRDPRIARRAAELALHARDLAAAVQAAKLWVEFDPESTQARQTLAGLLVAANRLEELVPHVAQLLAQEGDNLDEGLLRLNRLFARQPDKKAVLEVIDKLTAPYLGLAEAHFARAQAAAAADLFDRALDEIDQALVLRPDWEQAVIFKAEVQRRDSATSAMDTLRRHLGKYPLAREVRLTYARALAGERQFQEARREFQRLMADFPESGDVAYAVGILSLQLKDYAMAEEVFKKLLAADYAESNNIRIYLGQVAEERKRYGEALSWYSQVIAGPQFASAQVRYASVLARSGKLEEARRHLQQVAASSPAERVQYQLAEAQLLRENGKVQEAYDFLEAQLAAQPNQPELLYETAMLAEKLDRMDILEAHLRKLIEIKPDHAHAYNALGYSLADRNQRLDEAQRLIAKAMELAPDDAFILDSMGWVLFRKGDHQGALGYLQKAFTLRADPEIAAHLGEVLWTLGRREEAARTWREAAKEHPDNEVLVKVIKRFNP